MRTNEIIIYGFDSKLKYCMYCELAKTFCKAKYIKPIFKSIIKENTNLPEGYEFDVDVVSELLQKLGKEELKGTTMPQIFVNGNHVGGYTEFKETFDEYKDLRI